LWTLISGKFDVKSLKLKDGYIHVIQHTDGEFNISKALESTKEIEDASEEFHMDLKRIDLKNIDITKLNEENKILLDVFITKAKSKFKTSDEHTMVSLDSKFELTVLKDGDTTFVKHKHFDVDTRLDYVNSTQKLSITPSEIYLEGALFKMQGAIDFDDDMNLDIDPEKSLFWLTGGYKEWRSLEYYNRPWADCYIEFQEEFGFIVYNAVKRSRKLNDIKKAYLKYLNLPILYDFAISKNLVR
jgi:hypothetical protein